MIISITHNKQEYMPWLPQNGQNCKLHIELDFRSVQGYWWDTNLSIAFLLTVFDSTKCQ